MFPVVMNPLKSIEQLFFAIFGQTTYDDLVVRNINRPAWTKALFKIVFGIYMLVTMVVLINLLIAMMSDTYARIQLLFFAIFGQTSTNNLKTVDYERTNNNQPLWTNALFEMVFGVYMLVSVVVLINLLIAMMTDTYQRIQAQSDIEWKFGLSKLIRSMHRTTSAPSPINLVTTWLFYLVDLCKKRIKKKKRTSLSHIMGGFQRASQLSPRSKAGQKWLSKVKKGRQIAPKESVALSVSHLSPLGSQLSFSIQTNRIENVTDWEVIAKRYRALTGAIDEVKESGNEDEEGENEEEGQVGNNVAA